MKDRTEVMLINMLAQHGDKELSVSRPRYSQNIPARTNKTSLGMENASR